MQEFCTKVSVLCSALALLVFTRYWIPKEMGGIARHERGAFKINSTKSCFFASQLANQIASQRGAVTVICFPLRNLPLSSQPSHAHTAWLMFSRKVAFCVVISKGY